MAGWTSTGPSTWGACCGQTWPAWSRTPATRVRWCREGAAATPLESPRLTAGARDGERLLQVRDLCVAYPGSADAPAAVVDGISFDVAPGESVGVVGASGSGKTTLALSILGLLPAAARIVRGSIALRGRELLGLPEKALLGLRGAELALVPQEPGIALHPLLRVGDQVAEVLRAHGSR